MKMLSVGCGRNFIGTFTRISKHLTQKDIIYQKAY